MKQKLIATWWAGLPLWPFSVGAVASGPALFRDFSKLAEEYERWAGPIELIPFVIGTVFVVSLIGLIGVQWGRWLAEETISELRERAERAQELEDTIAENIREIINGIIGGFGKQLKLTPDDNSRLSLYVENGSGGLLSIGRWATNPNHETVGRRELPKNEGCVGEAWGEYWAFEENFGEENYNGHPSHQGMSPEVIERLKMRPQYLAALRIDDGAQKLAVLVFESMQADRFEEGKIKREMKAFSGYLIDTLKTLAPHYPKPLAGDGEDL